MKKLFFLSATLFAALISGCMTMKVEPIKIEVTVKVQVEKDLSNFFEDIDSAPGSTPKAAPKLNTENTEVSNANLSQGDVK